MAITSDQGVVIHLKEHGNLAHPRFTRGFGPAISKEQILVKLQICT